MTAQRPTFELVQCAGQRSVSESENINWIPIISCVAGFPPEIVRSKKKRSVFVFLVSNDLYFFFLV